MNGKRDSILKIARSVLIAAGLGFILFILSRGCIHRPWMGPKEAKSYAIVGQDKRELHLTLLPERRILIVYDDPEHKESETVLWEILSANHGRRYIGPVWNVNLCGEGFLGIRWIPEGTEPLCLKYRVVKKMHSGHGDSSFPSIGSERETALYVRKGEIKFSGMWLREVPTDVVFVDSILRELERYVVPR